MVCSELCRKLGIREGTRVLVLDPPLGFLRRLEPLPPEATLDTRVGRGLQYDAILLFSSSRAVLGELLPRGAHVLAPRGRLWASWPRQGQGFTDLDEEQVRAVGLASGLLDDWIGVVDEAWSALRFIFKERDRLVPKRGREISVPEA